ncbi:replication protein RepA [Salmonella enterica subsp. enterica serovar Typhimurium]|nr:replication protein RepA [Salmonella enterica]EDK6638301.1 replication protein RepA [Salmonella enterica subsp. enterica serovar Typhimurium]EGX0725821.1 replication protein RepA [Salmonella enterica]
MDAPIIFLSLPTVKINGVFAFLAPVKPQNQFPAALWRN